MSDNKELDLIIDFIKDMRDEQRKHSENSTLHRQETKDWQARTDIRLESIEGDLRDHKEGVIQNRGAMEVFNKRLSVLEDEKKAKMIIKEERNRKYTKYMKKGAAISLTITIITSIVKIFTK